MIQPKQGVILCGGLGKRLHPFTTKSPKPMIPCNEKPFLWHLLQQLSEQGLERFILLTGYLSEQISSYFGDGSNWGWHIQYSKGPVEWDTGRRIWEAKKMFDDCFMLLYSDNFISYSLKNAYNFHKQNQRSLTLSVCPKIFGNIVLDDNGIVQKYDNSRNNEEFKYVEIGYMIINRDQMLSFFTNPNCSFNSVLEEMVFEKEIGALIHQNNYYSISDMERWKETEEYLRPKKIILIDRDGVINRRVAKGEYVSNWKDFEWIPETKSAMIVLANAGFKFIVITNQAGVARKMIDPDKLENIHFNMKNELLNDGVEILEIYKCTHHWDDNCECRKPKPGMFHLASKDWLLRLDRTVYIGDDPRDCKAAYNANCPCVYIGDTAELEGLSGNENPLCNHNDLIEAVPSILKYFKEATNYDYY